MIDKESLNLSELTVDDMHSERDIDSTEGTLQEPLEQARPPQTAKELEGVFEIRVEISAVLGHCVMPVDKLLKMRPGSLIELDRKLGEAIDIHVNNRLVARGEVVVVEDRLGISMTEIVKNELI